MENFEIQCQNVNHESQKIILFCLNLKCQYKRQACKQCLKDFHQNHIKDCFSCKEIIVLLEIEHQNLIEISKNSNPLLKTKVDQILQKISEQLEKFQNIKHIRSDQIQMIVQIGIECLNNCYQQYLLTFCLKRKFDKSHQNIINSAYCQKSLEIKAIQFLKEGNQLFDQEQYSQSIKIYKIIFKLNYKSEQLLFNFCLALFLTNQNEEAEDLIKNNLQIFGRDRQLLISMGEEISIRKLESNPIQSILFYYNIQKHQVYIAQVLANFQHYDLALSEAELILKEDPFNKQAIIIKMTALLGQEKYGLVLEYIEETKKIKPEYEQLLKFICLTKNYKYFSKYWNYEINQVFYFKFTKYIIQAQEENVKLGKVINALDQIEEHIGFDWFKKDLSSILQKGQGQYENVFSLGNQIITALVWQGKQQGALKKVDQLLKISPNSRLFYAIKGMILSSLNRKEESLWCYKVSMYLGEPKDFFTKKYCFKQMLFLASELLQCQQYEEALEIFNNIKDWSNPENLLFKGKLLELNQKYEEAQKCYENVLEIDPHNKQARFLIHKNLKICSNNSSLQQITTLAEKKQDLETINFEKHIWLELNCNFQEVFEIISMEDMMTILTNPDEINF